MNIGVSVSAANEARAQEAVVVETPSETALESSGTLPNRSLLESGLFTFGASYLPVLVVAFESDRAADNHLYAPIAGPWLNLTERDDDCGGECKGDTVNRVLLATDGIFQGIGTLQVLGAFVFPQARGVTIASSERQAALSLAIMPTKLKSGSGLVAMGKF